MSVLVCIACGHPASEHEVNGCVDIVGWRDDGYPILCGCPRVRRLEDDN